VIHPDRFAVIEAALTERGINRDGIKQVRLLLEEAETIRLYMVHAADPFDKKKPYGKLGKDLISVCNGIAFAKPKKPYYEILLSDKISRRNRNCLMFLPKEAVEQVAELHPEPTPVMAHLILYGS
jgi:hypothetical protein